MHYISKLAGLAVSIAVAGFATAAPTADEIKQLGKSLTPVGAEKAGNKEGTIPPWTGGLCMPPAGYAPQMGAEAGGSPYIDPFADEKPLVRITAANLAQYRDRVDEGTRELFKRYPATFAINVYPTHRTACMPAWVYENTIKRVGEPKLVGAGPGLAGAHAQIPFPIPQNGQEAMWNLIVKYSGQNHRNLQEYWLADASGTVRLSSVLDVQETFPYWDNTVDSLPPDKPTRMLIATSKEPAASANVAQMRWSFTRADLKDDQAWSYIPGQRRVRLAPEFKYDTVATEGGGILLYDEINGFDGKMDKYDFKLVGKKEMYVPYNNIKILQAPADKGMSAHHENPELMRWELHRVWVVEATLKAGQRHVQHKKFFFIDEDSWTSPVYYSLDGSGNPHHLMHYPTIQEYDKGVMRQVANFLYDLNRGIYGYQAKFIGYSSSSSAGYVRTKAYPAKFFTPDALVGTGVR